MKKYNFQPDNPEIKFKLFELVGFWVCLNKYASHDYAIGRHVVNFVGLRIPVLEAMENEILKYFDDRDVHKVMMFILEPQY
jgi:hypothetical protein